MLLTCAPHAAQEGVDKEGGRQLSYIAKQQQQQDLNKVSAHRRTTRGPGMDTRRRRRATRSTRTGSAQSCAPCKQTMAGGSQHCRRACLGVRTSKTVHAHHAPCASPGCHVLRVHCAAQLHPVHTAAVCPQRVPASPVLRPDEQRPTAVFPAFISTPNANLSFQVHSPVLRSDEQQAHQEGKGVDREPAGSRTARDGCTKGPSAWRRASLHNHAK